MIANYPMPAHHRIALFLSITALLAAAPAGMQKLDEAYTAKIREYTTEPFFLTELVDHLPASDKIPSPDKILGYAVGTPEKLTYSTAIYEYMRALEKATPRVKVFSMGRTEEGREMLLVAVSDEANMSRLERLREITAKLADPRQTPDEEARKLIGEAVPFYWATGSIHSGETGSPEMLMELAYRLAVEDTPFLKSVRKNLVVLITPVLEVDGHDKQVDIYRYRKANPDKPAPGLIYWGKYVAHDNNRDGMSLSLALSRNVMRTFLEWHPQVLHDLHESIPFLYISTGMGPYNAWLDPIVINEWHELAYREIDEMTRRGVPGVWTHGFYDGWAANYMFYAANGHNSIGRFYETFGGRGADTFTREVSRSETSRAWYRPDPPLAKVKWSIRNNINLQQSAILFGMKMVADNREHFLENFYAKGKRSIAKALTEGPAAWVIPADDPRPGEAADLVNLLKLQGVEVQRSAAAVEVTITEEKPPARAAKDAKDAAQGEKKEEKKPEAKKVTFPAGSYIVRMDQPYSRMADMLLDTQYYSATDTRPYDDTGWSLGALRNVKTVRVTDASILKAQMSPVEGAAKAPGGIRGEGKAAFLIHHNTDNALATLRFRLRDVKFLAAEAGFKAAGREFAAGSFILKPAPGLRGRLSAAAEELGIVAYAVDEAPGVATHELAAPRIALVHTWTNTQNEGWVRLALDNLKIPYEYISDRVVRETALLREKYDVILLGPTGGSAQRLITGLPMRGAPIPWKKTELTPNLGTSPDQTDDMRGGLGLEGVLNLRKFVQEGGLFITIGANAALPVELGFTEGVSIAQARELQARGGVYNAVFADRKSPIAYGYGDRLAVYFNQAPVLNVSTTGGYGSYFREEGRVAGRPSGRGGPADPDTPQARKYAPPEPKPELKPGEEPPIPEEYLDIVRPMLPRLEERPRVVLRFAEERDLLVSGMLAGGRELANRPAVVDAPLGKGHVLIFANNPMWRQETQGSFFLVFNAMMNFEHLGVGRN